MFASAITFLGPWSWWVLGLLLAGIEIVVPGSFFIWFAVAAIVVGSLALVVDMSWQIELLLFVVLAGAALVVGRRLFATREAPADDGLVNDRMARQVGRIAVVETPVVNGTGHIRLDDTLWRADGPELPVGTAVRITGYRNGRFQVEPA